MTTPLTPPADAPLPWPTDLPWCILPDDGPGPYVPPVPNASKADVLRYLVAAANALPALLADHARLRAEVADVEAGYGFGTSPAAGEWGLGWADDIESGAWRGKEGA